MVSVAAGLGIITPQECVFSVATHLSVACCCVGVVPDPRSRKPCGRLCVASTPAEAAASRGGPLGGRGGGEVTVDGGAAVTSGVPDRGGGTDGAVLPPCLRAAGLCRRWCLPGVYGRLTHALPVRVQCLCSPPPPSIAMPPPSDFPSRHSPPCHSPPRQSALRNPPTPHPCPHDPPTHNPPPPLSTVRSTHTHLWRGVVSPGTSAPGWSGPPGP